MKTLVALSVALASTAGAINLSEIKKEEICYENPYVISISNTKHDDDNLEGFHFKVGDFSFREVDKMFSSRGIVRDNQNEYCRFIIQPYFQYNATLFGDDDYAMSAMAIVAVGTPSSKVKSAFVSHYESFVKLDADTLLITFKKVMLDAYSEFFRDWDSSHK